VTAVRTIDPKLAERIAGAIADVRAGKMIILVDDEDRENEGDLTLAAQFATPEAINFMAKEGRGLICLSLTSERQPSPSMTRAVRYRGRSPVNTMLRMSGRRGSGRGAAPAR